MLLSFWDVFRSVKSTHVFTLCHVIVAGWKELLHNLCQSTHPAASRRKVEGLDRCFDHCSDLFNSLSQWLTFKLLGITRITYLVGQIKFKLLFHGPLAE